MAKKKEEKPAEAPELTADDIKLISNVLYQSKWTGPEWERRIVPLINKLAKIADGTRLKSLL